MKKYFVSFALLLSVLVPMSLPMTSLAVDVFPGCSSAPQTDVCQEIRKPGDTNPIIHIISVAIEVVSIAIGAAAIIMIIVSGLRFILKGDDPNSVSQAKKGIIYALVGIVVAIVAQTIVVFVLDKIK